MEKSRICFMALNLVNESETSNSKKKIMECEKCLVDYVRRNLIFLPKNVP